MNIFKQYGIKEVADVVFYSIIRVGTEEFYIPTLYLDTLKVVQLNKEVETVANYGGKGNGKILAWNFVKDIQLSFEDALFSQMSLDMYMNGRAMAKMSDWSSAIAKLSVANKYGQKNYSIKAYPSPSLTPSEWEIVFRCAQKAGYDPKVGDNWCEENRDEASHNWKYLYNSEGQDEDVDKIVAENRWKLVDNYYRRTQPTPKNQDLSIYFDYNENKYESLSIIMKHWDREDELNYAQQIYNMEIGEKIGGWIDLQISYRSKIGPSGYEFDSYKWDLLQDNITEVDNKKIIVRLHFCIQRQKEGYKCLWAYISADAENSEGGTAIELAKIFTGFNKKDLEESDIIPTYHIGNDFFLSHILYYIFPNYLEDAIGDLCWCDLRDVFYKAMPEKIIKEIVKEITSMKYIGEFENDLYEAKSIDRMETCVVTDINGLKIDLIQQLENLRKFYNNEKESFTIFYDAKTMLPFTKESDWNLDYKILDQKCVRIDGDITEEKILDSIKSYFTNQYSDEWIESLTTDDYVVDKIIDNYEYIDYETQTAQSQNFLYYTTDREMANEKSNVHLIYFTIRKHEYIVLKRGTTYKKWTRTIDEDNTHLTYIGTNLSIDIDQLQGEFLVTGETLIREQKTGKDQRFQLLLPRVTLSPSTTLSLSASGDPTVFSMDVNVLMPKKKNRAMVELIQYDVEQDSIEGGYKIIPQLKKHTYTKPMEIFEKVITNNEEIY